MSTGLGKLKDYQVKLKIDPKVTPVAQPVLRIPFNRWQAVLQKLQELVDIDIIAYHQIELHPDSRKNTTFPAPGRHFKYKKLT